MVAMRTTTFLLGALVAAAVVLTLGTASVAHAQYRGPTRVNFDERLIKGQTTKAGSVYIFDRQQSEVRSLIDRKRTFRQKILRTVFEQ